MKTLPFAKLSGAGNDFIAINNWTGVFRPVPSLVAWTKTVCDRFRSIGADGVLLLERSKKADLKMRILNADGSEAEMCGNGVRCLAKFALMKGLVKKSHMTIETLSGLKVIDMKGVEVTVDMGLPTDYRESIVLEVKGRRLVGTSVNTGVPHTVCFLPSRYRRVGSLNDWGREIRFHAAFQPKGTNVDFVWPINRHEIHVRVYERGVEGETLACGTGACASAWVAVENGKADWPVKVMTSGGECLSITLSSEGHLIMTGPVRVLCEGLLHEEAWRRGGRQ